MYIIKLDYLFILFLKFKECSPHYYGELCDKQCIRYCIHETCFDSNGTCDSGCKCNISHELNAQGRFSLYNSLPKANRDKTPVKVSITCTCIHLKEVI